MAVLIAYPSTRDWIGSLQRSATLLDVLRVDLMLTKAFQCDFWMMLHGAGCPKRTTVWSAYGDIIAKLVPLAILYRRISS